MTNRLMMVTCAFASALTVQASTWTGAAGDDWTAPGNWNGGVPSVGDAVEIPATQVLPKIPAGRWPATGAYASFSVAEGATVTCLGDTTAVNVASGGTADYPHGMGVTIVAGSADIAGNLSAKGQGFKKDVKTVADMNLELPSHGGETGFSKTGYGRLSAPTALGTGPGTNPGGGAIALKISGELSLSGTIDADHCGQMKSTGGSVWIQAGTLSGGGTISASGFAGSFRPGASGRIAIEAEENTFTGSVSVWGIKTGQGGDRPYCSAPGTIFMNTVADVSAFGWDADAVTLSSAYSIGSGTLALFPEVKDILPTQSAAEAVDEALVVTRNVTTWDVADGLFAWTEQCGFKNKAGFVANTVTYTINGLRAGQPCVVTVNGSAAGSAADAEGSLTFAVELKGGFAQVEVDCSPSAKIAVLSPVTADGKDFTLSADVAELSGASAEATLYWDTEDRGTEASAWAHSAPAGALTAPGRIAADVVDVAKGATYAYRFCLMDGTAVWSKPQAFTAASEPQLGAVSFTRTENTGDLATFDVTLAAGSYADFKLLLADSDGVESVYEFGQVASGRKILVGKPFSGVKAYTWRAVAENMYGAWTNAAQSADLWCYKWTGVAGDGKWFTPGNWEGNATPGAMPTMAVLIDGDGFAEAPVVEYVPTADFRPCATVAVKNGAKLVQAAGTRWMRFDENGADLVLDGGIFDIGTANRCSLSNVVITAGGILTNSNTKELAVSGTLEMDSGSIGPVSTGEFTMGPGWHVTGGTVLSPQGILNTPTTATDFGDTVFRVYGMRLKASGQRYTWRSGGVIVGKANGVGWNNNWIYGEGNAYIDLTLDSTATFTYPMASSQIYEKAFKNWNARFRVNDKTVTEDEFRRYVAMSDFVYEDGVTHGTTFGFRQTAIFVDDGTIATDDGATFTATVGVELAGRGGSTLYLCYGAEDGGETIDGWETKIVATTPVTEAGSYSVILPSTELEAATTYSWRLIAVNDVGEMATPAKTFTTVREPTIGELTLGTVTEADGVFNVAYVGDLANLTVTVRDAEQNAYTGSLRVTGDGTYEILVEGLKSETAYTWSVTAQNGWGSLSKDAPADQSFTTGVAVPARTAVRSGLWNDPNNWEPAGVPKAGNDVTIPAGISITVDFETSTVDSLLLAEGATLVFDGWGAHLRVSGAVALNGTVTHVANSATAPDATSGEWVPNGRVNISCGDLTVGVTGRIDVRALGWSGSPEGVAQPGFGPGGGQYDGYAGSHGGRGGSIVSVFNRRFEELAAEPYDSVTEPSLPGSGGYGPDKKGGGAGGGVVRIVASGVVTVDGVIDADGSRTTMSGNHWVGSAGGAVYVKCLRIAGSGRITANGGDAKYHAGGGGGGRIAIDYDPAAQTAVPALVIQAKGGSSTWEPGRMYGRATEHASYDFRNGHAFYGSTVGEMGTLWFPDSRFLTALEPAGGTLRLAGRWAASVTPTTLNVNGDLVLEDAALQLDTLEAFSVAGDLVLLGQDAKLGTSGQDTRSANRLGLKGCAVSVGGCLAATNAWLDLDAAPAEVAGDVRAKGLYLVVRSSDETEAPTFTVHGDMACEISFVHVYANADGARPAALADLATSGGALFTVKGVLSLATRTTVFPHSHPANGGSPWFHLGALSVGVGSAFDAKLLGFEGGKNWVAGSGAGRSGDGWSGGGFRTSPVQYVGTGAYGGNGGNTTNGNDIVYGKAYDVAYAPFGPGSCGANGESFSASSGGAIRILCDGAVTMDGDLIADGDNLQGNWAAASSGGAIWIICRKFSGSAATSLLSAKGGDGAGGNSSVPAAGGRIAVWTNYKVGKLSDRQFAELLSGGLGEAVVLDSLPDWAGTASAVAGVEYTKSACNTKVITPAEDGTIAWLKLPVNSGLILLVR